MLQRLPAQCMADGLPGDGGVYAGGGANGVVVTKSHSPKGVATRQERRGRVDCRARFVDPFADFIRRYRWQAALILGLIAVYRISDVVMGIMANPFYVDMGFTKDEVAAVTKVFGVIMTLVGAFVGGVLSMRFGMHAHPDAWRNPQRSQQSCCLPGWAAAGMI
jgi:PAT family beta-lactamase induction signal transducer AmpG